MPVACWLSTVTLVALAQAAPSSTSPEPEWQTPAFESSPAQAPVEEAASAISLSPPDPRRWQYPTLLLAASALFGQSTELEVRVGAGVVFGRPTRAPGFVEGAAGFMVSVGLEGAGGKVSIPLCGTELLCGSRYGGGLVLRGGWAVGHIDATGVVRPVHSFFAQVVPYLASAYIPSQPLAPGAHWGEGGLRFDLGAVSSFRWPPPAAKYVAAGFYGALNLAWLAWRRPDTGAWRFGLTLGIAL